jgi:hypothetical protein
MEESRKVLWLQRFLSFDPERSNRGKSVRLNELTRPEQNCKGLTYASEHASKFYTISTINFIDRADYLGFPVSSRQIGAMP